MLGLKNIPIILFSIIILSQVQAVGPRAENDMHAEGEEAWGEAVEGLRMRLTAPAGREYVRFQTLPLVLELQNISDEAIPVSRLPLWARAEATDEAGKSLVLKEPVTISPWEGRTGHLSPGAIIRWTKWFDRFRFVNPPGTGSKLKLCFNLPIRAQSSESSIATPPLFFVKSNSIQLKLKDVPPIPLKAGNVPEQWAAFMDFVYREHYPKPAVYRAIHINRDGYITIASRNLGLPSDRMEVALDQEHLDKLAKLLRDYKVWELATVKPKTAYPDEGAISLSLTSAGTSLTGVFLRPVTNTKSVLGAIRNEIRALIKTATTLWEENQKGWGEAVEGVQCRLRADKFVWKHRETPIFKADVRNNGMRELFVARAQQLCELQFDGRWYWWTGEIAVKSSAFGPGRQYHNIPISLTENWRSKKGSKPLNLDAGKHTIRIAFIASPIDKNSGPAVRVVSNPVEIEILPTT